MRLEARAAGTGAAMWLALAPACAWAASAGSWRGATAGSFLKLDAGARSAALGGAYSAIADDALALYWNPAGLERMNGASAAFLHAFYLGGTSFDHAALARRDSWGGWGFGLQTLDGGRITQMDSSGVEVGHYNPRDLAFSAGYAGPSFLGGYSFGLAAKYVRSAVISSGETGAVDIGLSSPLFFDGRQRFAATVSNLGGRLAVGSRPDPLPLTFRVGGATRLGERWLFALDGVFPNDEAARVAAGLECLLVKPAPWGLAARAGFDSKTLGNVDGFSGGSVGLGFIHRNGSFDYAFATMGNVGMVHRIGATLRWGGEDGFQAVRGLIEAGDFVKARRELETAAEGQAALDARAVPYLVRIGKLAFKKGDCAKAKEAFRSAIERARTAGTAGEPVADAYAWAGRCFYQEGDRERAARFYRKALEAGPAEETRRRIAKDLADLQRSE